LDLPKQFEFQEIKTAPVEKPQLEEMKALAGSYEALFNRRAMKYRSMGLNAVKLTEADYKKLILEEYTFLKRPVFLFSDRIFIGNSPKNIMALKQYLEEQTP